MFNLDFLLIGEGTEKAKSAILIENEGTLVTRLRSYSQLCFKTKMSVADLIFEPDPECLQINATFADEDFLFYFFVVLK